MNHSDIVSYFEDVATRLKEIQHDANASQQQFARNPDHLRENKSHKIPCKDFTLVMDDPDGRMQYSGSRIDIPSQTIWILKKCKTKDYVEEDAIYDEAKRIMKKVISKMEHDREEESGLLQNYDLNSLSYRKAVFAGDLVGVEFGFTYLDVISSDLEYDPTDWL